MWVQQNRKLGHWVLSECNVLEWDGCDMSCVYSMSSITAQFTLSHKLWTCVAMTESLNAQQSDMSAQSVSQGDMHYQITAYIKCTKHLRAKTGRPEHLHTKRHTSYKHGEIPYTSLTLFLTLHSSKFVNKSLSNKKKMKVYPIQYVAIISTPLWYRRMSVKMMRT